MNILISSGSLTFASTSDPSRPTLPEHHPHVVLRRSKTHTGIIIDIPQIESKPEEMKVASEVAASVHQRSTRRISRCDLRNTCKIEIAHEATKDHHCNESCTHQTLNDVRGQTHDQHFHRRPVLPTPRMVQKGCHIDGAEDRTKSATLDQQPRRSGPSANSQTLIATSQVCLHADRPSADLLQPQLYASPSRTDNVTRWLTIAHDSFVHLLKNSPRDKELHHAFESVV